MAEPAPHPRRSAPTNGRVTLRTLARHLDLSVTTVSRALKRGPEVNAATVRTVEAAAKALGYRPHLGGLTLRTGRTQAVGLLLPLDRPGEINTSLTAIIEGASSTLRQAGYRTTVVPVLGEDAGLDTLREIVEERSVDGLIFTNTRPQDRRVKYLLEAGLPFVTFGRTELFTPHPWFDVDHEAVALAAAGLLFEAGHAAPLLVAPPAELTYGGQFRRGWAEAYRRRGLAPPDSLASPATPDSGRQAAARLIEAHPRATAAFVAADEACLGLVAGLAAAGRVVGRDIGLVTYGGGQLHRFINPGVTAYVVPHAETGARLARLLVRAIAGEDPAGLNEIGQAELDDLGSQHSAGVAPE